MALASNGTAAKPAAHPTANAGTSSIEEALAAIRAGRFVVVMDNEDRENEGDLIAAAQFATEASVAFMLRHSTGIVCVPAPAERLRALRLPLMVEHNTETHGCKFTVSVDLRAGNSTGVSAADRARTIRALADAAEPADAFNRPGHVFPLISARGGVLARAGHTEAAVDLARLAGAAPVGYICEMMDQDGRMMRRPDLQAFAAQYDTPLITISDLIRYRARSETLVERVTTSQGVQSVKKTPVGDFAAVEFASLAHDKQAYQALVVGDVSGRKDVPVFVVEGGAGLDADVRAQWAMQAVARRGLGVLVVASDSTALLQVSGELMARQSIFGMSMQVVRALGVRSVRLLLARGAGESKSALELEGAEAEGASALAFDPHGFGMDVEGFDYFDVPAATS